MAKTYIGIRIEPETKQKLEVAAKKEKRTLSAYISNALDELVKGKKK